MKTVLADFNAMTESGDIRLTTRGAQQDLARLNLEPPGWAWLTDREVFVGARLKDDGYYGIVGEPDWNTLVHLDDDAAQDFHAVGSELESILIDQPRSEPEVTRAFELLTQFEFVAPPVLLEPSRGYLAFRRSAALVAMDKPQLALIEIEEARRLRPDHPLQEFLYLQLLDRLSPDLAARNAFELSQKPEVHAVVLAAIINILAAQAGTSHQEHALIDAAGVSRLCDRFERAPGRPEVSASLLALVKFNHGMMLLALGEVAKALAAIEFAHQVEPQDRQIHDLARLIESSNPGTDGSTRVSIADPRVREIASQIRSQPRSAA